MYASIPLYFGAVANWISGLTVDLLYRRGHPDGLRPGPAIAGFRAWRTSSLIAAAFMPSVRGAVICLCPGHLRAWT